MDLWRHYHIHFKFLSAKKALKHHKFILYAGINLWNFNLSLSFVQKEVKEILSFLSGYMILSL